MESWKMLLVSTLLLSSAAVALAHAFESKLRTDAMMEGAANADGRSATSFPIPEAMPLPSQSPIEGIEVLPAEELFIVPKGLLLPTQPFIFKQKSRRQRNKRRNRRKIKRAEEDDDDDDDEKDENKDCKDGKNANGVSECEDNEFKCDIKVWKKFMKKECPETCGECD